MNNENEPKLIFLMSLFAILSKKLYTEYGDKNAKER